MMYAPGALSIGYFQRDSLFFLVYTELNGHEIFMKGIIIKRCAAKHIFSLACCVFAFSLANSLYAQEASQAEVHAPEAKAVAQAETKAEAVADETQPESETTAEADEQSEEAEPKQGFIKNVVNFVMTLPFGYDFGCEPTQHGSLTYLNVKYKWSEEKRIFSRLLFNYGTTFSTEPISGEEVVAAETKKYEREEKAIDFKLIPWGKQIVSEKNENKYFTIEPGLNFRIEPEKRNETYAIAYKKGTAELPDDMFFNFDSDQERKKFIIRPYYSTSLSMPLGKLFTVTLDVLYAPLYFYWGNYEAQFTEYGYDGSLTTGDSKIVRELSPDIKLNYNGFAENYVDANLIIGLFNIVAASGRLIYEMDHKTDFYLNEDFTTRSEKNKYEKLTVKVGGSLINIGKASMRIKAGVFYQWDWKYNHNADSWNHIGRWIFGVGMRNLY